MSDKIVLNKERSEELRRSYEKALEEGKKQFECFGRVWLTEYAKYALEYYDMSKKKDKKDG